MPAISVLMTVYNGEAYLKEAIESVLAQTFKDFEFIIVDDASTDMTPDIVQGYKDPRIVYLRNKVNLGQTPSLNFGLARCRGKYLARLDADDSSYPDRFQKQFDFLEKHPDIAVLGGWCRDISPQGKPLRIHKTPTDSFEIKCILSASGDLTTWSVNHTTVMIRVDVLKAVGLYDAEKGKGHGYPQDYELWSRLSPHYEFANLPVVLAKYRVLHSSDSRLHTDRQIKAREDITREKIHRFLPSLTHPDSAVLLRMLEYQPQKNHEDGKKVFKLFDDYISAYLGKDHSSAQALRQRARMKFYYLPQLFLTNKCLTVGWWLKIILRYPLFVVDGKLYRKTGKVLLQCVLSKDKYNLLIKKIFLFR